MPRNSRPRDTVAPIYFTPGGAPPVEPLEEEGPSLPLTGPLHDTLEAIVSGCAMAAGLGVGLELGDEFVLDDSLDDGEITEEEAEASADEIAKLFEGGGVTTRLLARSLLTEVLGRQPAELAPGIRLKESALGGRSAADVLRDMTRALLPANLPEPFRPTREVWRGAMEDAASLIQEVGLEEFDASCILLATRNDVSRLFVYEHAPESAHISLLEYLFDRAESVIRETNPLLELEREASAWEFECWSAAPPPGLHGTAGSFPRGVREQEYTFAERQTVTLGTSFMHEVAVDDGFGAIHPRQQRLAASLVASSVDVLECLGMTGQRVTLRSLRDGRTYDVHEHMDPIAYEPGWVGAGRLLLVPGQGFLRSPGMIFIRPEDPEWLQTAVKAMDESHHTLAPALALEALIADMFAVPVPRVVKPAESRASARDLLALFELALFEADVEREMEGREAVELDATLTGFAAALEQQAMAGGASRDRSKARAKKKKATKHGRKRGKRGH